MIADKPRKAADGWTEVVVLRDEAGTGLLLCEKDGTYAIVIRDRDGDHWPDPNRNQQGGPYPNLLIPGPEELAHRLLAAVDRMREKPRKTEA